MTDTTMTGPPVTYENGWRTAADWEVAVNGHVLRIPAEWPTDLASIPRPFRSFINTFELGGVGPPLLHDFIYQTRGRVGEWAEPQILITRRAADRLFRDAMKLAEVGWAKRNIAWAAVRSFGWIPWKPSPTTARNATRHALHTAWQVASALLLIAWTNWPVWTATVIAPALSAFKTFLRVPINERVSGVLYN